MEVNKIYQGDCLEIMKQMDDSSIDSIVTDPPYGYSFMGKDWDRAVPSIEVWSECLRVLKPGAFVFVMSAPRQDVQTQMIERLMKAGFRMDFTPIYWTYASGFPKAMNIGKMVDRKLGAEREIVGKYDSRSKYDGKQRMSSGTYTDIYHDKTYGEVDLTIPATSQAKTLDGSYGGFQPKPAIEVILVCMKPLSEKTFVDQALKNGKGITWLDDCRIPYESNDVDTRRNASGGNNGLNGTQTFKIRERQLEEQELQAGRFPANLLVSDDILNDGRVRKSGGNMNISRTGNKTTSVYGIFADNKSHSEQPPSEGSFSRYFDLDKWAQKTFPFLIVPKASKSEKNKGLEGMPQRKSGTIGSGVGGEPMNTGAGNPRNTMSSNFHPTVKPLKLMSYLITLGSRPGDVILDPFVGSGTTCLSARQLGRRYIGIELDPDYVKIAEGRLSQDLQEALLFAV